MATDAPTVSYESAFPIQQIQSPGSETQWGLSKREYFAAMALQGICANAECWGMPDDQAANYAVSRADALIHALNAKP